MSALPVTAFVQTNLARNASFDHASPLRRIADFLASSASFGKALLMAGGEGYKMQTARWVF